MLFCRPFGRAPAPRARRGGKAGIWPRASKGAPPPAGLCGSWGRGCRRPVDMVRRGRSRGPLMASQSLALYQHLQDGESDHTHGRPRASTKSGPADPARKLSDNFLLLAVEWRINLKRCQPPPVRCVPVRASPPETLKDAADAARFPVQIRICTDHATARYG